MSEQYVNTPADITLPRYDLNEQELNQLEGELIDEVKSQFPQESIYTAWIYPTNKYANIVRNYEAGFFPEVSQVNEDTEAHTLFLALIDTRDSANRVIHAATITGVDRPEDESETGFFTVDSLIEKGNFTAEEFRDYYGEKQIDLNKCLAIETNFRIGEKVEKFRGLGSADLVYLTIFKTMEKADAQFGKAGFFATINSLQIHSLQRLGINCEPLMGRTDLITPEAELGVDSLPVMMPYDKALHAIFSNMGPALPEIVLA